MEWADGWPVDPKSDAGPMDPDARTCLVLHTTEGSWEGAYTVLDRNSNWPHLMAEPWPGGRKVQAVPFSRAAKSLANQPGGVETNRKGTIQIELVGFAAHTDEWTDLEVDYLAELLRPIIDGLGIRHIAPPFYGPDAGFTLATVTAPQRMGAGEWDAWDGICGHQHVPENDHWDPGKFRIDRFLATLARTTVLPVAPSREDPDMEMIIECTGDPTGQHPDEVGRFWYFPPLCAPPEWITPDWRDRYALAGVPAGGKADYTTLAGMRDRRAQFRAGLVADIAAAS